MKRWKKLLLCELLVLMLTLVPALAAQGQSIPDILAKRQVMLDAGAGIGGADTMFAQNPSITQPYAAGALKQEYLDSGLAYLNYVRYVAGLEPVSLDAGYNDSAQHGATILAAINQLTHYPSRPAGMDDDFFYKGAVSTGSSNISMRGGYGWNFNYLQSAIQGCMDDSSSASNLYALGHRRWLINPTLGKVGFGHAYNGGSHYVVNQVFDWSGTPTKRSYVAWPSEGYFPDELLGRGAPWCCVLNPNEFLEPDLYTVTVQVTRLSDGSVWTFSAADYQGSPTASQKYFNVENSGYGEGNCIIFSGGSDWYQPTGDWRVDITGLTRLDDAPGTLSYTVRFFDPEAAQKPAKITCNTPFGGTVTASADTCRPGESVTIQVTPDEGHTLAAIYVNGVYKGFQSPLVLEGVMGDQEITALFSDSTGQITDGDLYYIRRAEGLVVMGHKWAGQGELHIPEALGSVPVMMIADSAFYGSYYEGVVTIPKSIQYVGTYAFAYMYNVTGFEVEEGCTGCISRDGVLFSGDGKTLLNYPIAAPARAYRVPDEVTLLYCTSFARSAVTDVYTMSKNVRAMTYTFAYCDVDLYCYGETQLAQQAANLDAQRLEVHDMNYLPTMGLTRDGRVRIFCWGPGALDGALLTARYSDSAMTRMTEVIRSELRVPAGQMVFLPRELTGENVRTFFLNRTTGVPYSPAV